MKIYCLSGLGVDQRAFKNIDLPGMEMIHIDWIAPHANDSLSTYASRLFEKIQPEDGYCLVGVSFGGMIAVEFARRKPPRKLFLISTIQSATELPALFQWGAAMRLHYLIPTSLMRKVNSLTYFLFGVNHPQDRWLLSEILQDTDPSFLRWAVRAIPKWNNNQRVIAITIHRTRDKLLPLRRKADFRMEQGGHFTIVTHGREISAIILRECLDH